MRTECVLLTDGFPVVKMCIHEMRRAVHLRWDEKAPKIDLDGMLGVRGVAFDPFLYLSLWSSAWCCYSLHLILEVLFILVGGYCNDVFQLLAVLIQCISYSNWCNSVRRQPCLLYIYIDLQLICNSKYILKQTNVDRSAFFSNIIRKCY